MSPTTDSTMPSPIDRTIRVVTTWAVPDGSGRKATIALDSSSGSVPNAATRQKWGRTRPWLLLAGQLDHQVVGGLHAGLPDRASNDLGGVGPVRVVLRDLGALPEQPLGQGGRLEAEGEELVVADDQLVLLRFPPGVGQVG